MKHKYEKDILNEHLEGAEPGVPTTIEVARKLLDDNKRERVSVTLRRTIQTPIRAESPARAHRFASVEGFCQYLECYGSQDLVILANAETGEMAAVLDESRREGFEIVRFVPCMHPVYAPWQGIFGRPQALKEMARFVIAHRNVVRWPNVETLVGQLKQIQVSRQTTMHDGIGSEAVRGFTCVTRIQGKESNQVARLPERLGIECPLFVSGGPLPIEIDVLYEADDDGVEVRMVSADADHQRVVAIELLVETVRQRLPQGVVSLGTLRYDDWQYVR
ncbi:MAG: DUF2303 family protein [Phycisphaerae bacterium]|nr:DUF2303 family protein [Phycisphaerae bacterium]